MHDAGHEVSWYYLVEQLVVHCNDIRNRCLVKLTSVFRLFEDVSPEFDSSSIDTLMAPFFDTFFIGISMDFEGIPTRIRQVRSVEKESYYASCPLLPTVIWYKIA